MINQTPRYCYDGFEFLTEPPDDDGDAWHDLSPAGIRGLAVIRRTVDYRTSFQLVCAGIRMCIRKYEYYRAHVKSERSKEMSCMTTLVF